MTTAGRVLVVDDDPDIRENLQDRLESQGYEVLLAAGGDAALDQLRRDPPEVVLLDLQMPGTGGLDVLRCVAAEEIPTTTAVITAYGNVERAVEAMQLGALDFIEKPFSPERIHLTVARALERERLRRDNAFLRQERNVGIPDLIGRSPRMQEIERLARRAADSDATVLLSGESGTGKEVLARNIHAWSERCDRPFVAVNCVALAPALIESELFGHEKGAFSGAHKRRVGRFEAAQGGTIFLDEIGSTQEDFQLRLLRVLQERCVERVGGSESIAVDVRVIAATNRDLKQRIEEGTFLEDLYYRLHVINIDVPPLRERRDDIAALAAFFLQRHAAEAKRPVCQFSDAALACLERHDWPGNVRELENAVERAVVLGESELIEVDDLPETVVDGTVIADGVPNDYRAAVDDFRRSFVRRVLDEHGDNQSQAAVAMGLQRAYLSRLMKRLGMR